MTGILLLLLPIVHALSYLHGNGQLTARLDGELEFYHLDSLDSTRTITDESAEILERQKSLPFGGILTGEEKYGFTGKELDESGLQYFGARYYDSGTGRFVSVDLVRDGINWYEYARSNPMKYVDPDGNAVNLLWDIPDIALASWSIDEWRRNPNFWTGLEASVDIAGAALPIFPAVAGWARLGSEAPKILEIGAGKGGFLAIMKKVGKLPADAKLIEVDSAGKDIASRLIAQHKGRGHPLPTNTFSLSSSNTQNVIADIAPDASWLLKQEGIDVDGIISLPFRDGTIYRVFYNNPVILSKNLGGEINRVLVDGGELVLQFNKRRLGQARFRNGLTDLIRCFGGPHRVSLTGPRYHEYLFQAVDGTSLPVDRMICIQKPPLQ